MDDGKGDGSTESVPLANPITLFCRERALLPTHGIKQPVKDGIHPPFY